MVQNHTSDLSTRVYRVDKFIVPQPAFEEFVNKVKLTHEVLRKQPGFLQDFLLEQTGGPGEFNFVTIVEWESQEFVEQARTAVMALHKSINFNPAELVDRLGIKGDIANYKQIRY